MGRVTVLRRGLAQTLVLGLLSVGIALAVPTPAQASASSDFVAKINAARTGQGRAPLAVRGDLAAVALAQAKRMASASDLFHNPNLGGSVANWSSIAENVGYGPDVATIHQAFMNSAGHRANILNAKYTEVGVGVVVRGHVMWVAEVFRTPKSSTGGGGATAGGGASGDKKNKAGTGGSKPSIATKSSSTPSAQPSAAKASSIKRGAAKKHAKRERLAKVRQRERASVPVIPAAATRAFAASLVADTTTAPAGRNTPPSDVTTGATSAPISDSGHVRDEALVTLGVLALFLLVGAVRLRFV